jgi:methylated-DNA-[protein]-cysteine S-methyltransferase
MGKAVSRRPIGRMRGARRPVARTHQWRAERLRAIIAAWTTHHSSATLNFPTGSQAQQPRPDWVRDDTMFAEAKRQLDEYFAGERSEFTMPVEMDGTDFQKEVWTALRAVPFGATVSYGDLANKIGRPKASRAVGAANHANPLPIVVPCHRVIGSDRSLTGFGGGLETKQTLLAFENPTAHRQDTQQDLFQSA